MKNLTQRINDLIEYLDPEQSNLDITFQIICQLRQLHEEAKTNEYSKTRLYDLVFGTKCLSQLDANHCPEQMIVDIRELQHDIVDAYGLQD